MSSDVTHMGYEIFNDSCSLLYGLSINSAYPEQLVYSFLCQLFTPVNSRVCDSLVDGSNRPQLVLLYSDSRGQSVFPSTGYSKGLFSIKYSLSLVYC